MTKFIHRKLHRWGIARRLNSGSNNYNDRGDSYIQTKGPRWFGRYMAVKVIHWSDTPADWDSIRITDTEHRGTWSYRWKLVYRRVA